MTRNQFLKLWPKYPAAPPNCLSLARWQRAGGEPEPRARTNWVAGLLHWDNPDSLKNCRFRLLSVQTEGLEFQLESAQFGERGEIPIAPEFFQDIFRQGDHVAVHLRERRQDGIWLAQPLMLLAPVAGSVTIKWQPEWRPFVDRVRQFFLKRQFTEIETPGLVQCPGLEPTLEPFGAELASGRHRRKVFLPTSPEIHLKKALCLGFTDIFEIKTCFRNGEISSVHQPEFHMLEWYRAYGNLTNIIHDLGELVADLVGTPLRITTFQALFREHLGLDLQPTTEREKLAEWCQMLQLQPAPSDSATDLFHRIWIDRLEPILKEPTVVRDFPPAQAALARIKPDGWADRFEFFWAGMEIANAFHEVNDPLEQQERWQSEQRERQRLGTTPLNEDSDLIEKMTTLGMPPTGGIALGLERLFMAWTGQTEIRDLRLFPYGF